MKSKSVLIRKTATGSHPRSVPELGASGSQDGNVRGGMFKSAMNTKMTNSTVLLNGSDNEKVTAEELEEIAEIKAGAALEMGGWAGSDLMAESAAYWKRASAIRNATGTKDRNKCGSPKPNPDWRFDTVYWHLTLNTGNVGLIDHSQPGWQVKEWLDLKESVVRAFSRSRSGYISLPGGIMAFVSSCSGSDGQMSFNLYSPKKRRIIHGTYCADRAVECEWWSYLMGEHYGSDFLMHPILHPSFKGRPWLAVGFTNIREMQLLEEQLPLTWCQYEQLLVDAWQATPSETKAGLRRRAGWHFRWSN